MCNCPKCNYKPEYKTFDQEDFDLDSKFDPGDEYLGKPIKTKKDKYSKKAKKIAALVKEKQIAYGDSFGQADKIMKVLYPNGISVEQMGDALVIIRMIDKLFRIANNKDAFGESPYDDIVGYALLGAVKNDMYS